MNFKFDVGTAAWLVRGRAISAEIAARGGVDWRANARELSDRLFSEFGLVDPWPVTTVTHQIESDRRELRVREYRPNDSRATHPPYLGFHGGGFSTGSIDELINIALCSQRAVESGFSVFDVSYRLAPEHPYPAALDDAYSALVWLSSHAAELSLDVDRLVVGGVSAGGNIAAALCLLARDRGGPPIYAQLLEVPVVDLRESTQWLDEYAAINNIEQPRQLSAEYVSARDLDSDYVSPLSAEDLTGLPVAHVMTAEWDPLRQSAEAYVERLRQAGNDVTASRHLGQLHGSAGVTGQSRAARLWQAEVVSTLREFGQL